MLDKRLLLRDSSVAQFRASVEILFMSDVKLPLEKPVEIGLTSHERAIVRECISTRKAVLVRQMNAESEVAVKDIRRLSIDRLDVLAMKFIA